MSSQIAIPNSVLCFLTSDWSICLWNYMLWNYYRNNCYNCLFYMNTTAIWRLFITYRL